MDPRIFLELAHQHTREPLVLGRQDIGERRSDQLLGVATGKLFRGAGGEFDAMVAVEFDHQIGRGESESHEPVPVFPNAVSLGTQNTLFRGEYRSQFRYSFSE